MIVSRSNDCPHCGDSHGNSCFITYDNGYKCYSCGKNSFKSDEYYIYRPQVITCAKERNLFVPEHTRKVSEFSLQCKEWLYNYHLYDLEIASWGICYCPVQAGKPESLLYPVVLDENYNLLEYQRRFFPKAFYSSNGVKKTPFVVRSNLSNRLILVEDYISALRCGQFVDTLCLFGTSLNKSNLNYIMQNYTNIDIWLDNDAPGITAANQIFKQLITKYEENILKYTHLYSTDIIIDIIESELSSKENSNKQIKDILGM